MRLRARLANYTSNDGSNPNFSLEWTTSAGGIEPEPYGQRQCKNEINKDLLFSPEVIICTALIIEIARVVNSYFVSLFRFVRAIALFEDFLRHAHNGLDRNCKC